MIGTSERQFQKAGTHDQLVYWIFPSWREVVGLALKMATTCPTAGSAN